MNLARSPEDRLNQSEKPFTTSQQVLESFLPYYDYLQRMAEQGESFIDFASRYGQPEDWELTNEGFVPSERRSVEGGGNFGLAENSNEEIQALQHLLKHGWNVARIEQALVKLAGSKMMFCGLLPNHKTYRRIGRNPTAVLFLPPSNPGALYHDFGKLSGIFGVLSGLDNSASREDVERAKWLHVVIGASCVDYLGRGEPNFEEINLFISLLLHHYLENGGYPEEKTLPNFRRFEPFFVSKIYGIAHEFLNCKAEKDLILLAKKYQQDIAGMYILESIFRTLWISFADKVDAMCSPYNANRAYRRDTQIKPEQAINKFLSGHPSAGYAGSVLRELSSSGFFDRLYQSR